jgi:hypothetical protein
MTRSLLRIDVEAEIRKLTGQRFKTPGDYAVELLKWAAAQRPMRIDLAVTRASFTLSHDGEGLSNRLTRDLAALFDRRRPDDERHAALVAIEDAAPELLAAFAVRGARVRIATPAGARVTAYEYARDGTVLRVDAGDDDRCTLAIRGRGRDPELERRLLREAGRYSIVPIFIDGERVNHGPKLDDTVVQVDLRNERLHGVVGLPSKSDLVRVVRLRRGIRAEEMLLASVGGMIFHAIIDENDGNFEATSGTLRRAGRRLYRRMAQMYGELTDDRQARALELLLTRYEHTREPDLLQGIRAFSVASGQPLDLDGIRRLAARGTLYAISIDEPLRRYDLSGRAVLRLTTRQRRFLEKELGAQLAVPPLRRGDRGFFAAVAHLRKSLSERLSPPFGGSAGRPVPDGDLVPDELAFLDAVRAEIRSGAFSLPGEARPFGLRFKMAEGQRRPLVRVERADGANEYRVSRDHALVKRMIDAFARSPAFLYPALAALCEGHDGYADNRAEAGLGALARLT